MSWPVCGAHKVIVTNSGNQYPSFPQCATSPSTGSRFVAYRDWDGTNAAAHSTGGAFWWIRNEGSLVGPLWAATAINGATATPNGSQVEDAIAWCPPNGTVVAGVRTFGVSSDGFFASVSADDGLTFGAIQAQVFSGLPAGFVKLAFFDNTYALDGTHILATFYGTESGQTLNTCVLLSSPDGVTWTYVATIFSAAAGFAGNECGLVRVPQTNRLVALCRNGGVNGLPAWSAYSDDDGATWSTPASQTNCLAQAPHGFAISPTRVAFFGRDYQTSTFGGNYAASWWTFDPAGALQFGPVRLLANANASNGGYTTFVREPTGFFGYSYWDQNVSTNASVILVKFPVRKRILT
jgi:hypothetical protein